MIAGLFTIIGVHAAPPVRPRFSWQEMTFSYSTQKVFDNETYEVENSGTFTDVYTQADYNYSETEDYVIKELRTVYLEANFSTYFKHIISGNLTVDLNLDVYRVNVDYGTGVKLYWFAVKKGIYNQEHYFTSISGNYTYYEESKRYIESTYYNISLPGWEITDTWADTDTVFDEINITHYEEDVDDPYVEHVIRNEEFSMPLILTVQMYTTENNDKIAWANLFSDFIMYKDKDKNLIYSAGNSHEGVPSLLGSTEFLGLMKPIAQSYYMLYDWKPSGVIFTWNVSNPYDMTIDDIASTIEFTPPTATTDTEISWGIDYPNFPINVDSMKLGYYTPLNATYQETTPISFSYDFDYSLGENQADLDMTWEIGKITDDTLYQKVKDCGLVMPQYNYFLGSFDLAEVDQKQLSVPTKTFTFESNDTIVAEINMENPEKVNYTVYDYFGADTEFESKGGSIHPNVIGYSTKTSFSDAPLQNLLYTLDDFVALDTTFTVADDLFRMETQNYPIWGGERFIHDPSLSIFYAPQIAPPTGIPGYNIFLFVGVVFVISVIMVKKQKKSKIETK